ncbi:hypothetical protein ACB094_06G015400 [Castanea mollissima]
MGKEGGEEDALPLFETKEARFVGAYKVLAFTVFVGICLIFVYRLTHMPRAGEQGRWAWIGMFVAELCFGLYWILTQSCRFKVVYHYPFKERLSCRYKDQLPSVDIFVCTADPKMEPPTLVINTIFSVMSYNYPPEKLSIYLSDDGASELTFYALLEASSFSKHWIPFCKKFNIQPRSPSAYFAQQIDVQDITYGQEWLAMKAIIRVENFVNSNLTQSELQKRKIQNELYKEMENRIDSVVEMGKIPKERRDRHKGFLEWNSKVTKKDHQSIVQIIIDGRDKSVTDIDGGRLPTLIRVSSVISNAPFILNLDCDMYANDADTVREALCFFMDDKRGHEISFVQYPQNYDNIMKNDIYGCSFSIEFAGLDGYGAAPYCGTGCFHRRESLCGKAHSKDYKGEWDIKAKKNADKTIDELEEASKVLTNCIYEKETQWGNKMGLIYGCPVEDIVTGLTIQCRGWKSLYYNPDKKAFLGVGPTTLDTVLIQHKRWSEGMFQIFFSKYCPFIYGQGKIKFGAQMGYCIYLLWAPISFPTLYYVIVPSLCLLHGISLFSQVKSIWFLPFAYVFVARNVGSIAEALSCGVTLKAWWNWQRMWVIQRTTSFFFGFIDTISRQLGLSETTFALTTKVCTEDVLKRYRQEVIDFGSPTIMLTIIATLALLNLFSLIGEIRKIVLDFEFKVLDQLIMQVILELLLVLINIPVYQGLFIRNDKGRIPSSVLFKSIVLASMACLIPII